MTSASTQWHPDVHAVFYMYTIFKLCVGDHMSKTVSNNNFHEHGVQEAIKQ